MAKVNKINIKIEGREYSVPSNLTVLEAAKLCGYQIPTLCSFNKTECSLASCRVCLVEVKGARGLAASCVYPVNEGMEISISSMKATNARRASVELLLSNHNKNCQQCDKNGNCELLTVAQIVGARDDKFQGVHSQNTFDQLAPGLIRDTSKCILCGRCIERCKNAQGLGILGFENRGFRTVVAPAGNRSFAKSPCIQCGQCVNVCPTGALMEHSEIKKIDEAMLVGKKVIVQTAPAVRAAIGEMFGDKIGTSGTGKMVAALHRLGFYRVFDTNFGADLTIMEEATELLDRVTNGGTLPMITSCSPGWINYMEYYYADTYKHVSTCKSPHQMLGAMIKTYYAPNNNIDPKDIFVVSVMPCVAKKYEASRPEMETNGLRDIDAVITTRELGKMIERAGIVWKALPDEDFDNDLFESHSGAAVIFGVTGGVMEAALRTAYFMLTGKEHDKVEFKEVRGFKGLKEGSIKVGDTVVRVAVASGMINAKPLLDQIRAGKSPYAFIEIMGCPGGCINGGGQPFVKPMFLPNEKDDILSTYMKKRASVLYKADEKDVLRQSHNNEMIQKLYKDFLGKPGSHKSHDLLHTHYNLNRERFPEVELPAKK